MDKRLKKAQISMEFMMLIAVGFLILITFSTFTYSQFKDIEQKKQYKALQDFSYNIYQEINIARNSKQGYTRYFRIPEKIDNHEYNFIVISEYLIVTLDNNLEQEIKLAGFTGELEKGINKIEKKNGKVIINQ